MVDKPIGKVTHYYNKLGVAVVEILAPIKIGDEIKIVNHDKEFTQEVKSMQIERAEITSAKKGQIIGLKIDQAIKEGCLIYKSK